MEMGGRKEEEGSIERSVLFIYFKLHRSHRGRAIIRRCRLAEARCERRLKVIQLLATVTSIFRCTEFPPPLSLYRTKRSS